MASTAWVIDVGEADFEQAVLQRSRQVPVVVDFWAPWCAPCRMLGPVLEKLAGESHGAFLLAKVNVDQAPGVAAAFGVQSIPAVFALRNAQVVNYFMGALPEAEVRRFLETILPSAAEQLRAEAQQLAAEDPQEAERKLRAALQQDPHDAQAKIALAGLLFRQGRVAESRELLDELRQRGYMEREAETLDAQVYFQQRAAELPPVAECQAAAEAAPGDSAAVLRWAEALAAHGQYEPALRLALQVVQRDKARFGEPARELMVRMFHALGPDSELASHYRRQLAMALY
jgi:putative thioredoxin